jgi:hypothetical protein
MTILTKLFLIDTVLPRSKRLLLIVLTLPLITMLAQPAAAQTEEEITIEIANYAMEHSESETREYVAFKITQMTIEEYFFDFNLSVLSGFFLQGSQCIQTRQAICDREYEGALAKLTGESAVLAAACVLITAENPWAFAACAAAVIVRHASQLRAATRTHQACYLRAKLECGAQILACIPQTFIVSWCTDYDFESCTCAGNVEKSPVIVDVLGNGFDLTDAAHGVGFDITGTGNVELLSWTRAESDDAFLVLDRNANGVIDNGQELFGNFTPQPPPLDGSERNGFWALTGYDLNADGKIDKKDAVFTNLRLWQDSNHNGLSEPSELHTLPSLGLNIVELNYKESKKQDQFGNQFRYRAKIRDAHNSQLGRWAWDVFLMDR